jgi:hypothetical protein
MSVFSDEECPWLDSVIDIASSAISKIQIDENYDFKHKVGIFQRFPKGHQFEGQWSITLPRSRPVEPGIDRWNTILFTVAHSVQSEILYSDLHYHETVVRWAESKLWVLQGLLKAFIFVHRNKEKLLDISIPNKRAFKDDQHPEEQLLGYKWLLCTFVRAITGVNDHPDMGLTQRPLGLVTDWATKANAKVPDSLKKAKGKEIPLGSYIDKIIQEKWSASIHESIQAFQVVIIELAKDFSIMANKFFLPFDKIKERFYVPVIAGFDTGGDQDIILAEHRKCLNASQEHYNALTLTKGESRIIKWGDLPFWCHSLLTAQTLSNVGKLWDDMLPRRTNLLKAIESIVNVKRDSAITMTRAGRTIPKGDLTAKINAKFSSSKSLMSSEFAALILPLSYVKEAVLLNVPPATMLKTFVTEVNYLYRTGLRNQDATRLIEPHEKFRAELRNSAEAVTYVRIYNTHCNLCNTIFEKYSEMVFTIYKVPEAASRQHLDA